MSATPESISGDGLRVGSLWALAARNMRDYAGRTALSALAVLLGVAVSISTGQLVQSMREGMLTSQEVEDILGGLLDQIVPMVSFIGVVMILAAGFLVFNAFNMTLTQRKRQIGALRTLGASRGQVTRLVLLEGLLIGGAGSLGGLLAGPLLTRLLLAAMRRFGGGMFVYSDVSVRPQDALLAAGLGVTITLISTLRPARRAANVPPLAMLREQSADDADSAPDRDHTIFGAVLVTGVLLLLLIAPPGAWASGTFITLIGVGCAVLLLGGLWMLLGAGIGAAGRLMRRPLSAILGTSGRLVTDNLGRARKRVMWTVLTLAFGLIAMLALGGFMRFMFEALLTRGMGAAIENDVMFTTRINVATGWEEILSHDMTSLRLDPAEVDAIRAVAAGRGAIIDNYFTVLPELSFLGDGYFSYIMDPAVLARTGDTMFTFQQGNWEDALPIMEAGCGVLVAPLVAERNGAGLGESFPVSGPDGPVTCTVAGIGSMITGASVISTAALDDFQPGTPIMLIILPNLGEDSVQLAADLEALAADYPLLSTITMQLMVDRQGDAIDLMYNAFSVLLLLVLLTAALSVVNTTIMSIYERSHEIGLLRAVGATRRQVRTVLLGEAALMGLIAGVFGVVTGGGLVLVLVLGFGAAGWGIEIPLRTAALGVLGEMSTVAIIGLLGTPLIAMLAAWFPVRRVLRSDTLGMLTPEHVA